MTNPQDPYGVPTGVVPRLNPATRRPYAPDHPVDTTKTLPDFGVHAAPIQQAVDDWLLMERKARAWDMLEHLAQRSTDPAAPLVVDLMGRLVHPAQEPSSR